MLLTIYLLFARRSVWEIFQLLSLSRGALLLQSA